MKKEIIELGLSLRAPLDLAWSCYEANEKPCQTCGPDFLRRTGFKMNGIIDPYEANNPDMKFWEGCIPYAEAISRVH